MTTIQNNFQARVQLQNFHNLPVEILRGDSTKSEPFQLPSDFLASSQPISATKQAFLDMASAPLLNLDDLDESFSFNDSDSDPEILLSDSDEEDDDELIAMGGYDELECDTAIDSEDMNNLSEGGDDMEDFDELVDRNSTNSSLSVLSFHSASEQSADARRPRRVFIDLPESQQ